MSYITVDTKLVALLGTPLRQSVSYLTQNQVYREMGMDYFYFPVELDAPEQLKDVIAGFRHMNFAGFAVTKPYKETIMAYLDGMDDTVEKIGACNTVVVRDGKLIGYNTDGIGCTHSMREERGFDPEGKIVVCYGAGGAARAVLFQLAEEGVKKVVVAALDGMAERLAEDLNRHYPGLCQGVDISRADILGPETRAADVVLNLTGLGMGSHENETPLDKSWFRPGQLCYDAIYNPETTRFLREAEEMGCQTLNGLGMVIYQGLEQIKLWTGEEAPAEIMYKVLDITK